MDTLSDYDTIYYQSVLVKMLQGMQVNERHNTKDFHFLQISAFVGDRQLVLKCLRTLEKMGYVIRHDGVLRGYRWQMTQKAVDYLANYNNLNNKPL